METSSTGMNDLHTLSRRRGRLTPPRPWWKLWGKEEREPELPVIVADLRNAA